MLVTVFTPVYNRADLIGNLYESLKRQSSKNFEWLIIDDGSSDNICQVVDDFKSQKNDFEINFYTKENGGKHTCINMATDLANGELFFIVDSDDYVTDDAIEKVEKMYDSIRKTEEVRFCGIAELRVDKKLNIIGTTFDGAEYVDATSLERDRYNIRGDKAEVFVTDILKRYKFPVFKGENFVTENVVWLQIANDGYKIRWYNEPIYVCEYLEGGLTDLNKKDLLKNFYGDIYTNNLYIQLYKYSLPMRVRLYGGAYEKYLADKDIDKLHFILTTFGIKKPTLLLSYQIYKAYKMLRRR